MNKTYAGIGSRETPDDIIEFMMKCGAYLANKGYTLRSGGADGADLAFERGCDKYDGIKEIYLPWTGFNGSKSKLVVNKQEAFDIAEQRLIEEDERERLKRQEEEKSKMPELIDSCVQWAQSLGFTSLRKSDVNAFLHDQGVNLEPMNIQILFSKANVELKSRK